jgi:hypothetical protein
MDQKTLSGYEAALNRYPVGQVYKALRIMRRSFNKTAETREKGHGLTEGVSLVWGGDIGYMRLTFVKDDTFACWDDYELHSADTLEKLVNDVLSILTGP